MKTEKMILGVVAGLATGVLLGVLFAPKKGSKTRKDILDKSEDLKDELKGKLGHYYNGVMSKIEENKNIVEELVQQGKSFFEDAKKDLKDNMEKHKV